MDIDGVPLEELVAVKKAIDEKINEKAQELSRARQIALMEELHRETDEFRHWLPGKTYGETAGWVTPSTKNREDGGIDLITYTYSEEDGRIQLTREEAAALGAELTQLAGVGSADPEDEVAG